MPASDDEPAPSALDRRRVVQAAAPGTAEHEATYLRAHLRPGMRVLDLGCGSGATTIELARVVAPGEVIGYDRSLDSIAAARAQAEGSGLANLRFEVADIQQLELPDASVDVAFFGDVLAHLADPQGMLARAFRMLKPGGLLATREPEKQGDWFGGPHREVLALFNTVMIEDWKAEGGDPYLGRCMGTLLLEAGCQRVELRPSYAAAQSTRAAVRELALGRLAESSFADRVVRRGWITPAQLDRVREAVVQWAASDESVVAIAECWALGWKP